MITVVKKMWTVLWDFVDHYMPLWLPVVLLLIQVLVEIARNSTLEQGRFSVDLAEYSDECIFALLAFWIWAIVTNAHGGMAVASSGRRKWKLNPAEQQARQKEFGKILLLSLLTTACYVLSLFPLGATWQFVPFTIAVILPLPALGVP